MSIENPRVVSDSVWVSGGDIIIHWVNSRGPSPAPISSTVGDPVTQVSVGQDVLILADVTKIHPSHKNFAFVVQIQDESGATVSLSWFKTVAYPGFSVPLSSWQPWTPEAAGSYIATIYVKDTVCKTPAYTQIMQDRSSTAAFAVMKDEVATLRMLDEFAFIDGIVTDSYLQGKLDTCSVAETEKGQLDLIKLETDASDQQLLCQLLTCIYQPSLGEDFATPVAFEINVINESSAEPTGVANTINESPAEPTPQYVIRISDARMEDKFDNSVTQTPVGQQVKLVSEVTNGQIRDQGFTYLVQVQESSGTTVSFSWLTGNYTAAVQVMTAALSWTPTNYGSHIVTIYVKDTDTFPFEILSGYVLPTTVPIDELGDDLAIPATFEIIVTNESGELVQEETSIPSWIKNTAGWWADGSINDTSFLEGISYLIQNDIIVVSSTEAGTGTGGAVPEWVKNTAGWWAADQIDDDAFVNAIQYLIKEGLIQV